MKRLKRGVLCGRATPKSDQHERDQQSTWRRGASCVITTLSEIWIAGLVTLAGAGISYAGSKKQADAIKDANASNTASTADQNSAAWTNYLMTRGISPTVKLAAGQMPTSGNFVATNVKLPLWAGYTTTPGVGGAPNTYALATPPTGGVAPPTAADISASQTSGTSNTGSRIGTALDPLGLVTGKKPTVKSILDPLGFF